MVDHPTVRDCQTCSRFVLDSAGEISTYPADDGAGGIVSLPMRHAEAGSKPPCSTCPKIEPGAEAVPQPPENDYGPWFWEARQLFLEGRALHDFGQPDPLMRQVFAEFDQAERRRERNDLSQVVVNAVARLRARK